MQVNYSNLDISVRLFHPCSINGYNYSSAIPEENLSDYRRIIALGKEKFMPIAEDFRSTHNGSIVTEQEFLDFVSHFIGYHGSVQKFNFSDTGMKGTWFWNDKSEGTYKILINTNFSPRVQKFATIHEVIHPLQDIYQEFKDDLVCLPEWLQAKAADSIANKVTAEILVPSKQVNVDIRNGYSIQEIANKYDVSYVVASHRVTDCL